MNKLFYKVIKFLLLPIALYIIIHILFNIEGVKKNYFGELYNYKKEILKEKKEKRKIVIIGGSNGKFSYNSKLLEDSTGLQVVNAAIQGNCGLLFYFNFIEPYLRKGDIVVLSPEYDLLLKENGMFGNYQYIQLAGYETDFYKHIFSDKNQFIAFFQQSFLHFKAFFEILIVKLKFPKGAIDYIIKKQHNAWGDVDSLDNNIKFNFKNYAIEIDTLFYPDSVFVPSDVDTAAILYNYFAIYLYNRHWNDSIIQVDLVDTITQNKISGSDFLKYKILRPQEVIINTTTVNNYTKYIYTVYNSYLTNSTKPL